MLCVELKDSTTREKNGKLFEFKWQITWTWTSYDIKDCSWNTCNWGFYVIFCIILCDRKNIYIYIYIEQETGSVIASDNESRTIYATDIDYNDDLESDQEVLSS